MTEMTEPEFLEPLEPVEDEAFEEVAIVGMAGRFPGAADLDQLWHSLREGKEALTHFSDRELLAAGVAPALLANPRYVRAGSVLDGIELFDAPFFGFSPREAALTDPQQRLLLECAWEALEQAGLDPETFSGRIGVYAGAVISTYLLLNLLPNAKAQDEIWQMVLANDKDTLATRVSYKLDLRGPSLTVQTACSTSLVAVHLARQSLLDYECDAALAGGVAVRSVQAGHLYQDEGILSPDGHCRPFDARARGTRFGSGAGLVVLKRLSDALADGDTVHAILKSSAVNNDGSDKMGFTAPSVDGQAEVVTRALTLGGIDPESVSYVETHGTATPLGDPIEVAGLTRAYRAAGAKRRGFCALGSVKGNFGHLDSAAGVAGLLKTVLALKHREIPPSLNYERPNPQIDFAGSPFFVNDRLRPWEAGDEPRRAGVSSFGIGGTNAHLVVEEAPELPETSAPSRPWQLLVLSARSQGALESATAHLAGHLRTAMGDEPGELADAAWTLQAGRRALPWRRAVVCRGREEAVEALSGRENLLDGAPRDGSPSLAFLFPGQGSQRVGMGAELYATEPLFRREVDRMAEILRPHLGGEDLRQMLLPPAERREEAARRLDRTSVTQPALFVIETALARLWMSWGLKPQALLGHSIGEYVAAHLSGTMSLEDALALVAARGRLIEELPGGAMMAVPLPEDEILSRLGAELSLAAVNGPAQCVVSGPEAAVEELRAALAADGVEGRRLATSHAFHSRQMEPVLERFTALVRRAALQPPQIPWLSNVTGSWITAEEATDPAYWALHLRRTVRFADGLEALLAEPDRVLLEVGPGRALSRMARRLAEDRTAVPSLPPVEEGLSEPVSVLTALGSLWAAGVTVDWKALHGGDLRRRVPLPTYPFERRRHWIEPTRTRSGLAIGASSGTGVTAPLPESSDPADRIHLPAWRRSLPPVASRCADAGTWLVLLDDCGLGEALAERLEQAGCAVARAGAGRAADETAAQVAALRAEGRSLRGVVHLGGVSRALPGLEEAWSAGFASLSALTRVLLDSGDEGVTIVAVSNGAQRVTGQEELCPAKATLLGWARTAPHAGRPLRCRAVDVALPEAGGPRWERLVRSLTAEILSDSVEPLVAWRGDDRWHPSLEPAPLAAPERPAAWLQPGGTYLLTGGLEGMTFALARRLASVTPVRLAFAVPPDGLEPSLNRVQVLEELGAEVLVLEADPADRAGMRRVLDHVEGAWGPLRCVFHLPPASAASEPLDWMRSALVLDELLGDDRPLDALVLFAWLEPPADTGRRAEVWAASALVDAVAQARSARGAAPTVAIDWGWGVSFESDEASEILDRILVHPAMPQVVVFAPVLNHEPDTAEETLAGPASADREADLSLSDDPITARIAAIWREVLGVDRVGPRDRFFDLGGDSLIALRVLARLREVFPVELPVRSLFETPTVPALRDAVEMALTQKLEELSEEEAERLVGSILG